MAAADATYNEIGQRYVATRAADSRIVEQLVHLIGVPPGATICDVGAGSGNYTCALADKGYHLLAVEPSATMAKQARPHERVSWYQGSAENLPLPAASADAVVCTLAAHHFSDFRRAIEELKRVAPTGPWVFLTMDPRRGEDQWFTSYFPEIRERDFVIFPPVEALASVVRKVAGRNCRVSPFPLPPDLTDEFMYAPWARPERYLEPLFRANTSGFALADAALVEQGLTRLSRDLASGLWDENHGRFRRQKSNDVGFCFLAFTS